VTHRHDIGHGDDDDGFYSLCDATYGIMELVSALAPTLTETGWLPVVGEGAPHAALGLDRALVPDPPYTKVVTIICVCTLDLCTKVLRRHQVETPLPQLSLLAPALPCCAGPPLATSGMDSRGL
jgi:hypothetical protein